MQMRGNPSSDTEATWHTSQRDKRFSPFLISVVGIFGSFDFVNVKSFKVVILVRFLLGLINRKGIYF